MRPTLASAWLCSARGSALAALAFVVAGTLAGIVSSKPAWAADRPLVVVTVGGDPKGALDPLLVERVRAGGAEPSLRHQALVEPRVVLEPPGDLAPALAYVWIDAQPAEHLVLVLLDGARTRGLLRYVSRSRGDEVAREELGHVLETAVEGLLAGETIGMTRRDLADLPALRAPPSDEPPEAAAVSTGPTRATPSPARMPARLRVSSSGSYELMNFDGSGRVLQGPGLVVDVHARTGLATFGGARFILTEHIPMHIGVGSFTFRRDAWAGRALGVLGWHAGGGLHVTVALGAAVEVVRVLPSAASASALLAAPSTRGVPVARAELSAAYVHPIRLALTLTLDIDPSEGEVDAMRGDARVPVYRADPVRAGIRIEIGTPD